MEHRDSYRRTHWTGFVGRYGMCLALLCSVLIPCSVCGQRDATERHSTASNDPVYVVVGRIDGTRRVRRSLGSLERALRSQAGIEVTSNYEFAERATQLGIANALQEDGRSLQSICDELEIDAAVYITIDRHEAGRDVVAAVYAGVDGHFVSEHIIPAPSGRLTARIWSRVASVVAPDLRRLSGAAVEPVVRRRTPRTQPRAERQEARFEDDDARYRRRERRTRDVSRHIDEIPVDDEVAYEGNEFSTSARPPIADLRLGGMSMARTFEYVADPASQVFAEGGINYELGLVPGLAIDAQLNPFAQKRSGVRGLGVRVLFEKAFFRTQQTVTKDDGSQTSALLDSNHSHIFGALTFTHAFHSGAEVGGFLGYGHLTFELAENDEYSGSNYGYLSGGAHGYIPFGTPVFGMEARASVIPFATFGDSVQEVGADASVAGFGAYLGLAARLKGGLTLAVGGEYTAFNGDISGEGRGGRIGKSSSDGFTVIRFLGGYRF